MDVRTIFFYLFAAVLLFSAVRVITARNPVHAVLYLIFAFSQAAGIWLLMRAEFLAILLVMVYLGAVMVLFLFVVMMLDIRIERVQGAIKKHLPLALVIFAVIVGQMIAVLWAGFPTTDAAGDVIAANPDYNNTKELGILMYTEYVLPVQVAGVILLVGMIAAIALTLRWYIFSAKPERSKISPSKMNKGMATSKNSLFVPQASSPIARVSGSIENW